MSAVHDLLHHYQHVIGEVHVATGSKGIFDVAVNGDVIFSKHAEGRHAQPGEVLERFTAYVGADLPRFDR